jgi:hypothetical protein
MEGYGMKLIAEELKEWRIQLTTLLHDADASTLKNIRSIFKDVVEQLCLGMIITYYSYN